MDWKAIGAVGEILRAIAVFVTPALILIQLGLGWSRTSETR